MWFDVYRCRLRTASQSCTNWIRCSSGRPWGIMWTGILSIMWWISCMLYWDSAWSQSLTVSIAGIRTPHLNIPKLYHQKEVTPFFFSFKKEKKCELLSSEYIDCILGQCESGELDLFWFDHPVMSPSGLASPSTPEIEGLFFWLILPVVHGSSKKILSFNYASGRKFSASWHDQAPAGMACLIQGLFWMEI